VLIVAMDFRVEILSWGAKLRVIVMTKRQTQALTEELGNLPRMGVRPTGAQAHRVQPMTSTSPLLSRSHHLCPSP
jgi:hypothetical protein